MQSRSTRFGLFAACLTAAVACGGRSTIDFGASEAAGASAGTGGIGKGGTSTVGGSGGTVLGGSGGGGGTIVGGGGAGGTGAVSGGGSGGGAGCEAPANECVACHCAECPGEVEKCNADGGCAAIVECAVQTGCSGFQCYLGPCQSVIDQNGGPTGSSAQLAQDVGQCSDANNCPCDGGTGGTGGAGGGGGSGGTGPIACIQCISQECPAVQECIFDQACRDGAICAFQNCLSGGGGSPNLQCMIGCFNGDFQAALKAFQSFQCFFSKCADTCGGLIPGLPGSGGGFPGAGGSGGN